MGVDAGDQVPGTPVDEQAPTEVAVPRQRGFCTACGALALQGARFCGKCGRPLDPSVAPDAGALVPVPKSSAVSPGSKREPVEPQMVRAARRWWGWVRAHRLVVGGAVLAVVVAVTVGIRLNGTEGVGGGAPDAPVKDFFDALAARDGVAAASLVGASGPLWAAGALASGYTPPQDVQVSTVVYGAGGDETRRDDRTIASVTVAYLLGDVMVEQVIGLRRDGGVLGGWSISAGAAGELRVSGTGAGSWTAAAATVTGERTPAPPGVYEVGLPETALFAAATTTVSVRAEAAGKGGGESVQRQVRPEAVALVQQQVRARTDECAAQGQDVDLRKCVWVEDSGLLYVVEGLVWRVETYPTVTGLEVGGSGVVSVVGTPGRAIGEYRSALSGQAKSIDAELLLGGTVAEAGGGLVWSPGQPED